MDLDKVIEILNFKGYSTFKMNMPDDYFLDDNSEKIKVSIKQFIHNEEEIIEDEYFFANLLIEKFFEGEKENDSNKNRNCSKIGLYSYFKGMYSVALIPKNYEILYNISGTIAEKNINKYFLSKERAEKALEDFYSNLNSIFTIENVFGISNTSLFFINEKGNKYLCNEKGNVILSLEKHMVEGNINLYRPEDTCEKMSVSYTDFITQTDELLYFYKNGKIKQMNMLLDSMLAFNEKNLKRY